MQINGYHKSIFITLSWFILAHVDLLSRGLLLSKTWMFSSFERPLSSLQTIQTQKKNHMPLISKMCFLTKKKTSQLTLLRCFITSVAL